MNTSLLLLLTLLLTISTSALAQSKDPNKPAANAAREKSAEEIEAERLLKERRANAQSLLINLAADAERPRPGAHSRDALGE